MDIQRIKTLKGQSIVLDNNVLNDLIELDRLDLLNRLFSNVFIPLSILEDEVLGVYREKVEQIEYKPTAFETEESFQLFMDITENRSHLTEYDVEVIVIAHEKGLVCCSNEKKIRSTCDEYGVTYTGTIGLLICAYENQIISYDQFTNLLLKLFYECQFYYDQKLKNQVFQHYCIKE